MSRNVRVHVVGWKFIVIWLFSNKLK